MESISYYGCIFFQAPDRNRFGPMDDSSGFFSCRGIRHKISRVSSAPLSCNASTSAQTGMLQE